MNPVHRLTLSVAQKGESGHDGLFLKAVPVPGISTLTYGGGAFRLLITGDAGRNYTVESSTDLLDWRALQTTNPPATPFFWLDTGASNFKTRFYRVIVGPGAKWIF